MPKIKYALQIVCSSLSDIQRAARAGADCIELSSCWTTGGVTPSPGMIRSAIASTDLPVDIAIRPREGHLVFSAAEQKTIIADAVWCIEQGASRVTVGGVDSNINFDFKLLDALLKEIPAEQIAVGRAFDCAKKRVEVLPELANRGIAALATSAGQSSAIKGLENLKRWNDDPAYAAMEIYAAGNLLPQGVGHLWEAGLRYFKASARKSGGMAHEIRWFEGEIYIVDARRVERLANQLDKLYSKALS
ncbi:MAG: copper homeostasis protein CutC [Flavobacteriales bacterium]|nr:copper homeostasis protein CutC [Flavobacteriales bacterium]